MDSINQVLVAHPFFKDLPPAIIHRLIRFASLARLDSGQYVFTEGEDANNFYLVLKGSISLEINIPNYGPVTIENIGRGNIMGWSWLYPPFLWHFDARAKEETELIILNGKALRAHIEIDHEVGYNLMKSIGKIMGHRLQAARRKIVEFYKIFPAPDKSRPEWQALLGNDATQSE